MRNLRAPRGLLCLPLLVAGLGGCGPGLDDRVRAYEEAYNSHDVARVMALYGDDATFDVVGQFLLRGKGEIQDLAEYDVALNIHMAFSDCASQGDTLVCRLAETNEWFKLAGIELTVYSVNFVFSDGLIKLLRAEPSSETNEAMRQVVGPLVQWASQERPERLRTMMPEGRFVYNAENAGKSLALLQEWQHATEAEQRVRAYENAANDHDVDRVMSLYHQDIRFQAVGAFEKVGKGDLRKLAEYDSVVNTHLVFSDLAVSGDTVRCRVKERNDWLRLAGIEEVEYDEARIIFRDGLIAEITAKPSEEGAQAIGEVLGAIVRWASENRGEELAGSMPGGEFIYTAQSAGRWLSLLREWRNATEHP
jgi:ketosteroid isomerase-like protein